MIQFRDTGDENDGLRKAWEAQKAVAQKTSQGKGTPCPTCKYYIKGDSEAHMQLVMTFCDACPTCGQVSDGNADEWYADDNPTC